MSEQEMRELDAWIAEHLFGWDLRPESWPAQFFELRRDGYPPDSFKWRKIAMPHPVPRFSDNAAAAMEVLKKCCTELEKPSALQISICDTGKWCVGNNDVESKVADTLEITICLFAKELFNQQPKGKT